MAFGKQIAMVTPPAPLICGEAAAAKTAPCICAQRGDGIYMEKAMLCTGSKSQWL